MTLIRFFPMSNSRGWLLAATLAGVLWLASAPAQSVKPSTVNVGASFINIETHVAHEQSVLRISGPDGYALTLHLPLEHGFIQVDLLSEAEPRRTQQGQDDGQGWSSLPPGTYYYEVVLFGSDKEVGRDQGVFEVGADGRASEKLISDQHPKIKADEPPDSKPLSDTTSGKLQRVLGVLLEFLVPSAQAQSGGDFADFVSIRNVSGTGDSRLNLNATNSIAITNNSWRLINNANAKRFSIVEGSATERLSILQGGNVGIGTAAPQDKLHVNNGNVRITNGGATWVLNPGGIGLWFNRVTPTPAALGVVQINNTAPSNSLVAVASGIGIGTDSPAHKLDVVGDRIRLRNSTASDARNIILRADGAAVDLQAINASLFLQSSSNIVMHPFSSNNVGIGLTNPERQLHLRGPNATFRMDRSADTAAFLLVRTNTAGTPLKTFVVGTNASGSNNGEFIINDLGAAVSGGGARRMTITNAGNVIFTGTVSQGSSARYKQDIETLEDARAALRQLRGVRFIRKDTGRAGLGLIAEEVREVFPEVVEVERGAAEAVNYSALVAVLVEAFKEQEAELAAQRAEVAAQKARVARLESRLAEFETLEVRLNQLEGLLIEREPRMAAMPKP